MLFKDTGYVFATRCLRSLLTEERADASASTSARYDLTYSRTSDLNEFGKAETIASSEVVAPNFAFASSTARSTNLRSVKRTFNPLRAKVTSRVVADSISTSISVSGPGGGDPKITSSSAKGSPVGAETAR